MRARPTTRRLPYARAAREVASGIESEGLLHRCDGRIRACKEYGDHFPPLEG